MLVDTSVLARTVLPREGIVLHIVPQNLFELWVVATRPVEQNGLGLTPVAASGELARIKSMFRFLPDTKAVYSIWEELVVRHNVAGKPAHDARLVAAMMANGLQSILTFDATGFSRYPGIEVINPADVVS